MLANGILLALSLATDDAESQVPPPIDRLCGSWRTTAETLAPSGLSSLTGSGSSGRDVLSVGALAFPPFVLGTDHVWHSPLGHPEPDQPDPEGTTGYTGRLLVGGTVVEAAAIRWCADRVERRATIVVQPLQQRGGTTAAATTAAAAAAVSLDVTTVVALSQTSRQVFWEVQIGISKNTIPDDAATAALHDVVLPTVDVELQTLARMYTENWGFGHNMTFANRTAEFNFTKRGPNSIAVI
eukprot:gene22201-19360_t